MGANNPRVAKLFNEIADLLELKGDNPFRIRAYRRAALSVEALPKDIASVPPEELPELPGIGKDLAGKIRRFLESGRVDLHEELKKEIPAGLLEILHVPGVGPKTAKLLFDKLGVTGLDRLEALAREGKLAGLPGIKEKTEENILKGIELLKRGKERRPLGRVLPLARDILARLREADPRGLFELAGSIRRWKDTIKDIDILACVRKPEKIMEIFVGLSEVAEVLAHGTTKSSVVTADGIQVDIRVVGKDSFGAALQYFTGSKAHNIRLREMASRAGLKINEYGVFREPDGKKIGGKAEKEVYAALGLPFIPPEIREDAGEIEAAAEGKLPDLVVLEEIRGDLHAHTNWSDGAHPLDELVAAARAKGYGYIAVTDHSKGLGVAHGLDEARLRDQVRLIREANRKLSGFRILAGIEVDIRGDGSLDLPDELLAELDVVVASIHSGFKQPREQITKRLLAAVRNRYVSVIAHPTGRLIGERDAYAVDLEAVFREAARRGVALEINAYPLRLDLDDAHARMAKRMGIPLVVSTDAHVASNFDFMSYGVAIARRGWIEARDVLNTLAAGELLDRLQAMRNRAKDR
ncbi:MAG: DNA polymerase/3'-5' exonuclease PolX [Deltaproteobacteria bacterium]|nr:DNA polymerase/3'-5' exonuclease PolX [Deltaproteobacteria bacterium]